jgi:putative ABC transport system permease protein
MRNFVRDVRYGLRVLRKSPGSAAIAVLALGLGAGVNTAVFSLADVLIYRPLLVADLDRLVVVQAMRKGSAASQPLSVPDLLDWRAESRTVENLAGVQWLTMNLSGTEPATLDAARVSPALFSALGAKAELGRTFLPEEEQKGRDRVVVLSHALWESRFGASPDILRRTIKLEGEDYQIVGVMPKDFEYPQGAQILVPASIGNQEKSADASFEIEATGRLRPGVSLEQANAEFQTLARRSEQKYPGSHAGRSARVNLLREYVNGDEAKPFMQMLRGAVLFVLLIACANVAGLQFARISLRKREIAVRSAMGAGRARLMGQFLTESAIVGLAGALAGVACAQWGTYVLRAALPAEVARYVPGWSRLGVEWHALAYAIVISVAGGVLAGVAPAWVASRSGLAEGLNEGRGMPGSRGRQRVRSALVVAEIVLAVVLLIGAGLMVSGVRNLAEPAAGIQADHMLLLRIDLPVARYGRPEQRTRFQEAALDGFRSLAGAESVALASSLPYAGGANPTLFTIEGRPAPRAGTEPRGEQQAVSADYFRNLHIRLERGRLFDERDGEGAPAAVIVSECLAERYFAGGDPIGKRLRLGAGEPWLTIVGVVADIRRDPWEHEIAPVIYQPFRQAPAQRALFLLRTAGDPRGLGAAARAVVARIDPDQPIRRVTTYRKAMDDRLVGLHYVASMMAVFGVIAMLLSAAGVYGVVAFSVAERRREIGLRVALGARGHDVVWMVGKWGLLLTGCGLALGVPAAFGLAGLLANLVFGVGAYDAVSFAAGIGVLCAASMLACYVPVRRALAVDPMVTLRAE